MAIILILATIIDVSIGLGLMSVGSGAGTIVGIIFVIIGILGIWPVFSMLQKNEKVNNLSNEQDKEYEKFVKGMEILKGYLDMGVTNVYDIVDEKERQQIKNINDFCVDYIMRQEELNVAIQEKKDNDFNTGVGIAAGVVLGSVLSSAISKHMDKSHQRRMERMRKNLSNRA